MPPDPIRVDNPWELIAAVLVVAGLVSAAGRFAEAGYIRRGRRSVPRATVRLLRANSRVSVLSTLPLLILGFLALRAVAEVSTFWAIAVLVTIVASILAWRYLSSVSRSGHTEADRLEHAGRIADALTVLERDRGFASIQRLVKRGFRGGDPKLFRGIEKDFLEIARLVLAVKNASKAAAQLGVDRDLTDAYWHRADSISRPTWRRFEVIATARRQGFLSPVLREALTPAHATLLSGSKARTLRDQTTDDIQSLKRLGEELVAETTVLATRPSDEYEDAAWWKDYLEAKREMHSEDGGWSKGLSGARMGRVAPGMKTVAAIGDLAALIPKGALRSLFFLGLGLVLIPQLRNQPHRLP